MADLKHLPGLFKQARQIRHIVCRQCQIDFGLKFVIANLEFMQEVTINHGNSLGYKWATIAAAPTHSRYPTRDTPSASGGETIPHIIEPLLDTVCIAPLH